MQHRSIVVRIIRALKQTPAAAAADREPLDERKTTRLPALSPAGPRPPR